MSLLEKNISEELMEQINSQLQDLSNYKPGTEEYKSCLEGITKLYKVAVEDELAEIDSGERILAREEKNEQHKAEMAEKAASRELEEKKFKKELIHKYIAAAITGGIGLISIIANVILIRKGFEFEQTGTFTSTTFRNLFNKLQFWKK